MGDAVAAEPASPYSNVRRAVERRLSDDGRRVLRSRAGERTPALGTLWPARGRASPAAPCAHRLKARVVCSAARSAAIAFGPGPTARATSATRRPWPPSSFAGPGAPLGYAGIHLKPRSFIATCRRAGKVAWGCSGGGDIPARPSATPALVRLWKPPRAGRRCASQMMPQQAAARRNALHMPSRAARTRSA